MKLIRKTAPLFFLSIFSLLTLHQVLPHEHHEHEGFQESYSHIEDQHHSHDKGHHHHNEEEAGKDFDFFGFLLGNHVHSISTDNIQTVKHVVNQKVTNKKNLAFNIVYDLQIRSSIDCSVQKFKFDKAPPDTLNKIYLSTSYLRGPPSLG